MNIKQIVLDLCALSDEQEWFEFKENWFQPEALGEYVSALSNAAAFHYKKNVVQMFQAIIEDRDAPKVEKSIDGYSGFLFYDDNGMTLVAMHWQHRFNHTVGRYNDIYRVQMPNITPHVCRHTYCSNTAKSGMNPKTLQYLMGHSDISVTMNVYTHIGFDDAEEELKRMEEFRKAQAEVEQKKEKTMSQKMFKVV